MAPKKRSTKSSTAASSRRDGEPPAPFRKLPEVLAPFVKGMSKKHVYIAHIDGQKADFKRKIFLVPVLMNIAVVAAFVFRMYWILPYYFTILVKALLQHPSTFPGATTTTWSDLGWEIAKRGISMFIDLMLFVFVWPWPVEFVAGQTHGSPVKWRWAVGFRDKEIYVRRSRDWQAVLGDVIEERDSNKIFTGYVAQATAPMLQEQKTGYLLMNNNWDLDWKLMVRAHRMVDKKEAALDVFRNLVLVHHEEYGWLSYDLKLGVSTEEEQKRRQVFAFRDALSSMDKEDLFFRWVEIVQFEATQPGGFGPEKQEAAAKRIRELFEGQGVDFDKLWKETVGENGDKLD
ncbi:hypothetical protein CCM_01270 [Cordyceps militaris CM01]|uniref:Uncharacterized protein n=2 Tax=Cordyceps militaris TaxID=73501 RepID=G3J441_CORMM|nr:uncharacterized protein CCM_01270 [Cordyceps militaris CM01]ATY64714.1 hypothetical protein A9K55_005057 [Cordyceps militaris]EGX96612.1 hypothetical protein CCM_01270 [Cordyceps militaris CM01]